MPRTPADRRHRGAARCALGLDLSPLSLARRPARPAVAEQGRAVSEQFRGRARERGSGRGRRRGRALASAHDPRRFRRRPHHASAPTGRFPWRRLAGRNAGGSKTAQTTDSRCARTDHAAPVRPRLGSNAADGDLRASRHSVRRRPPARRRQRAAAFGRRPADRDRIASNHQGGAGAYLMQ
jgi:hypothetical protein